MRWTLILIILFFALCGQASPDSMIMRQVENAPPIDSIDKLAKLMKSITQNLKKDEEKAYAALVWIVKNIDYDEYKKNQIEDNMSSKHSKAQIPQTNDILKTRLGVCSDIAELYQKMMEQADIKAVTINGCTGEINKKTRKCKENEPGHTWNAVWLNNQWELVDPTWAITGKQVTAMEEVTKKRNYDKELKKREKKSAKTYQARENRSVNKKWFMTSPKTMEEDHHPEDEKWTLTNTKDRRNKNL